MSVFRAAGAAGVLRAVVRRIRTPRAHCFGLCRDITSGRAGLEVGGPSPIFARGGMLPVYPLIDHLDNCTFARCTIWEGPVSDGNSFIFQRGKAPGRQFIAEGADLRDMTSEIYDFVLSSHMLEHTANPLRALSEWGRLLKPGGGLILVVPHRDGTFDHQRPITAMSHLVDDLKNGTTEEDLSHVPEVVRLHDVSRDSGVHPMSFRERAERNAELRSIHHHVFDSRLAVATVTHAGLDVIAVEPLRPYHVVVLAIKPSESSARRSLSESALGAILERSPFKSDRQARET